MSSAKFSEKSFNGAAFGKYVERLPQVKKNELIKSKVLKGNREIRNAFSSQGGSGYAVIPMFGLLDDTALNYDGQTDITARETPSYERGVVVIGRANAWVENDFADDITGGVNFMDNVASQVAEYWDNVYEGVLLSILKGIFSMTGTKNLEFVNGHTYGIASQTGDAAYIDATTLNSAIQKASGDNKNKFSLVIMHSSVATRLENLSLLNYLKYTDTDGIQRDLSMATWNGRSVIIDDNMPVDTSGSDPVYTTYVLGEGAIEYENIGAKVEYEMSRDPKTNGGRDTLYSRQRKCLAPFGISYTKVNQTSLSPENSELEDGGNWCLVNDGNRVEARKKYIDHKCIPIARIISK